MWFANQCRHPCKCVRQLHHRNWLSTASRRPATLNLDRSCRLGAILVCPRAWCKPFHEWRSAYSLPNQRHHLCKYVRRLQRKNLQLIVTRCRDPCMNVDQRLQFVFRWHRPNHQAISAAQRARSAAIGCLRCHCIHSVTWTEALQARTVMRIC